MKFYKIAPCERIARLLTYSSPRELRRGQVVEVDLRGRRTMGVVWKETEAGNFPVKAILREFPTVLPDNFLVLAERLQDRFLQPLGLYLNLMIPPRERSGTSPLYTPTPEGLFLATEEGRDGELVRFLLKRPYTKRYLRRVLGRWVDYRLSKLKKKGFLLEEYRERRAIFSPTAEPYLFPQIEDVKLSKEGEDVARNLLSKLQEGFSLHLLYGITGSGKTFVLLKLIEEALKEGGGVVYLVPEISMVPFPYQLLSSRFGGVEVVHSMVAHGRRGGGWRNLTEGRSRIALGARSAIFAPVRNLKLIIVDEEHDLSYDQENTPRYNAVAVAEERGKIEGAMVVFSSATPSVETYHRARQGEIELHVLKKRLGGLPLPRVTVVSMKGKKGLISREFSTALQEEKSRGKQALVLMNRRGFTSLYRCKNCGYVPQCPHCELPLTYHREERVLQCHYCGYQEELPSSCPVCGGEMAPTGAPGIQKLVEAFQKKFPQLKVERFDADVARKKRLAREVLKRFYQGEIDLLVGTQLISKGHNFPGVTLVGVFFPDLLLKFPDFTSAERTFQLITQMVGRAGRVESGRAFIQTRYPEHHAIQAASSQDYEAFFSREMEFRRRLLYPPFVKLVRILVEAVERRELGARSRHVFSLLTGFRRRGPALAPFQKIGGKWRAHIFVEFEKEEDWERFKGIYWEKIFPLRGVSVIVSPSQVL